MNYGIASVKVGMSSVQVEMSTVQVGMSTGKVGTASWKVAMSTATVVTIQFKKVIPDLSKHLIEIGSKSKTSSNSKIAMPFSFVIEDCFE